MMIDFVKCFAQVDCTEVNGILPLDTKRLTILEIRSVERGRYHCHVI